MSKTKSIELCLLPGAHSETKADENSVTSVYYLYETIGLSLGKRGKIVGPKGNKRLGVPPLQYRRSFCDRIRDMFRCIAGFPAMAPIVVDERDLPVIDWGPPEPKRRPGDVFEGFQFKSEEISEISMAGANSILWRKQYNPPVSDTGRIEPNDVHWPLSTLKYHDMTVSIRHKIRTEISATEWWLDLTYDDRRAYQEKSHSIVGELDGRKTVIRFVMGMVGLGFQDYSSISAESRNGL